MPRKIMKLVIDDKIPYIHGIPEALGFETLYLPGAEITRSDVKDADALIVRNPHALQRRASSRHQSAIHCYGNHRF